MDKNGACNWAVCEDCKGFGKKKRAIKSAVKKRHHTATKITEPTATVAPKFHTENCLTCAGKGIIATQNPLVPNTNQYPHVAIIGGGIGGVALAVACLHRGIPFTLFERDSSFDARSQGYGLTLQQASKAMAGLGILHLSEGVVSTKHVVHNPDGKIIGEWGMRKWMETNPNAKPRKNNIHNIHIARQALRMELINQLGGTSKIQWNHQLLNIKYTPNNQLNLSFMVNGEVKTTTADLVVGADGIRSTVRKLIIDDATLPLTYLGCMVILGICPLSKLQHIETSLLDSATVFQTANGNDRIYVMPFTAQSVMWQLSFPITENEALNISLKGAEALKQEAIKRTKWHSPIPQIVEATQASQITGYPAYDRELLQPEFLQNAGPITLIGDAAHPMSPFKGQGANQALLDALALARAITNNCAPNSNWQNTGIRTAVLNTFESDMITRSAVKVKESREAAQFLHTEIVLQEGNITRGGCAKISS